MSVEQEYIIHEVDTGLQILSMPRLLLPIRTTFLESVYPTLRFNGTSKYRKKISIPMKPTDQITRIHRPKKVGEEIIAAFTGL